MERRAFGLAVITARVAFASSLTVFLAACSAAGGERAPTAATGGDDGASAHPGVVTTGVIPGPEQGSAAATSSASGAVLYGIGVSTDPYVSSSPDGFGVATSLVEGNLTKTEVRGDHWCIFHSSWLSGGRILVPRYAAPICGRPIVFRFRDGKLEREGPLPLAHDLWVFSISPDGTLVAAEPMEPCCSGGARPSGRIVVAGTNGSRRHKVARGHLAGWTPEGRVVLYSSREEFVALDLESGAEIPVLRRRRRVPYNGLDGQPRWSADGGYVAVRAFRRRAGSDKLLNLIVIANARGKIVRTLHSSYAISMFAWSPRGRRLAYTTSGFPTSHEPFVLDGLRAKARRIFAAPRHFDWITWSPDSRWLLLDDEGVDRWRLFSGDGATRRTLPRPGGRPLWCCPQNSFSASS